MGSTKVCVLGVCVGVMPGGLRFILYPFSVRFVSQGSMTRVGGIFQDPKSISFCWVQRMGSTWQEFGKDEEGKGSGIVLASSLSQVVSPL